VSPAYRRLLARLDETRTLGVSLGLDRVREALVRLGQPQRSFASVQVAGTNGKGSTAAMAESVLRAAGWRTGLFTSPHLCRFTERIRIDGRDVDGDRLAALDAEVVATGIPLTYFEVATVLALLALRDARVDVAVLETGLGGRLDAVTAVDRVVATAITSIGLDHTDVLGPTVRDVAREKAGIVRAGVPLYLGPVPPEADQEIAAAAAAAGATLRRLAELPPAPTPALAGTHQASNATLALALARDASLAAGRPLAPDAVVAGLRDVRWPGRLEWAAPDVLLDGAHNVEGARALATAADELLAGRRPRVLVASMVRGKDAAGILAVLAPAFDRVVATRSRNQRSLEPEALVEAAPPGLPIEAVADPTAALVRARAAVAPSGAVVVAGSLFLVGELRAALRGEACDPDGGDPLP
jgi:dihydrofolate synthase/folylpolyglutamate synthase